MRTFRFLAALMMAVVCVGLSSCSKDDEEEVGSADDLVGKWQLTWSKGWELDTDGSRYEWDDADDGQILIFNNDGTGYETGNEADEFSFTWKLNGNTLTLTYNEFEEVHNIETLNASTLKTIISRDDKLDISTYKKID